MADNPQTSSRHELLIVALQDLGQGRAVILERMPAVEEATVDTDTCAILDEIRVAADDEQAILDGLASGSGDMPNLWASGIFDDACRDISTTAVGVVRDIALIGAIRKLLASDIVSLETALRLGARQHSDIAEPLARLHTSACDRDQRLLARLQALTREDG